MNESSSSLNLRPFQEKDTDSVIAVIQGCYADYGQKIELETLDDDLLKIAATYPPPHHTFQVLEDDSNTVIGTVAVKSTSPTEVELKRVFLHRDHRGKGFGRGLSQWAIDWAKSHQYKIMHIWSDVLYETAHHLYRRLGAEDTGQRRTLGGINHVDEFYFRLDLTA